jgi:uncharacterized SAM-binding protein YcdF (DUF218 family)
MWRLLAATLAALLWAVIAFTQAGTWLIVADPLQPASAIVVFGGGFPYRAMGAARLYKEGWAREVWLTGAASAADEVLGTLGVERRPEEDDSRRVLERMEVPPAAIRLIGGAPRNTDEEVRVIAQALHEAGGNTVILMTSKNHTRRVRALWRAHFGNSPMGIVRYTPDDRFRPERWWKDSADAESVVHEWFGLLNVWTGARMSSRPR